MSTHLSAPSSSGLVATTNNRSTNRYSVLQSLIADQDTDIEDELARAQKRLRDLKARISAQSKKNFVLERDVRYLDSRIALLIQNRMALDKREEVKEHFQDIDKGDEIEMDERRQQQYSNLFILLQSEPRHIASLCRLVSLSEIDTLLQTVMFTLYGNQYESREEHLLLTVFQSVLAAQFETATKFGSLLRANTPVSRMMTTYTRRGPGQSYLKSVLAERINSLIEHKDLNLEINPLKLTRAGAGTDKALASLEVVVDELDSLAGLAPPTPKPTTPTRPATNTRVSKAPISDKLSPKSTCSDAKAPPSDPPLTARTLETVLQTALLPVYACLDTLEASRAAAVLLPTPPSSPPQPAADNDEVANASHLVHLYAKPDLTVLKVRQALRIPVTIPIRQMRKGDVLIHLPNAIAASCLRLACLDAGFAPATPIALFAAVVHGLPMTEEAKDRLIETVEERVKEVGVVRSVRRLPSRRGGALCGSAVVVLWNNEAVSSLLNDEGRLCIDTVTSVRCERARGKKEMTHEKGAGQPAGRTVDGAQGAQSETKSTLKGAAGAQELKKRGEGEEEEAKDEPARAKLAKSGGGMLATSPSPDGNGRKSPVTTTTTVSTPANPFEPVLPPELASFSIE
ncbi:Ras GTPase-activating protein [Rhodotorula toruloides NP11]|uniref:Ras GTPase-activating protein n=1 Tax=Rhodotorula toruloides (strain NP11) TaxID=1130832 RepID=M7WK94_RHOT1|nr:Ras GTPase-activating protein [Rhodotorula toruloides NP11]EMS18230.1 Ras GTPase-activating protein [Rhodotorula toruloides NP11]